MIRRPPRSTLFPTRRSSDLPRLAGICRLPGDAFLARAVLPRSLEPDGVQHARPGARSEEHTSELQSLTNLVCRLLLEKKKTKTKRTTITTNKQMRNPTA